METAPVQRPLTLILPVKSEEAYEQLHGLLTQIQSMPPNQNPINVALDKTGIVHFARFTFIDKTRLGVFTSYDGDLDSYLNDFAIHVGPLLDQVFEFVDGAPPRPVLEHRQEFIDFVKQHDLPVLQWYSAYPTMTVLDIQALADKVGP